MNHLQIMNVHFNNDDYPYDYELEVWKDIHTCRYYFRDRLDSLCPEHGEPNCRGCRLATVQDFDQFLTIGQTLRWVHTGKADTNYTWRDIDYFSGAEFQMKYVLDMQWEEFVDSGTGVVPVSLNITFPTRHST